MRISGLAWILLCILALIWGGTFVAVEFALRDLGPFTIVFFRVSGGCLALWAFVLLSQGMPHLTRRHVGFLLLMGLLNNALPFSLIFWGQTHLTGGLASVLNATTPLFAVMVAHILTRDEKATGAKLLGVALGIAGVAVLVGPEALTEISVENLGQFAVLAASCSYAFSSIVGRQLVDLPPAVSSAGMLTSSTLLMFPVMLLVDGLPSGLPSQTTIISLIILAIICTAVAYILYFRILALAGSVNLMLVTFMIPVAAIALGAVMLGETLSMQAALGTCLILLGLAAVDGRIFGLLKKPGPST